MLASRRAAASAIAAAPRARCSAVALSPHATRSLSSDHGHGPATFEPPFQRLPMPNGPLPEQHELIWDDGVAPEMAVDIDAPHISKGAGLAAWLGGFAFFFSVFLFARATDHPARKPTVDRDLPMDSIHRSLGDWPARKF